MASPVVLSSNPASNSVDVFVNVPLTVTFDAPGLDLDSINSNSVVLLNALTQSSVPVDLSYNPTTRVLTVTPFTVLAEDSIYKIRFPGTDIALGLGYVIKSSGSLDPLVTTVEITFTTGRRNYIEDSVVDKDATNLSLEGDIMLPSNVKALGPFAIEATFPKNHAADVAVSLDGSNRLYIKFNKALSGTLLENDWLNIDTYPMLDSEQYLAQSQVFGTGSMPTMTGLSYSGQYLYANFNNNFPNNAGVTVTLGTGVVATDGSTFGNSTYALSFTTDRFPKIGGVHVLRNELLAASDELNNDYMAAVLLKNTVRVINRFSALSFTAPQYLAHRYVVNLSIMDILEDKDLEHALVAGSRRTLGDMTISIDQLIGQMALKYQRAKKDAEEADDGLQGIKKLGAQIQHAVCYPVPPDRQWHGVNGRIYDYRFAYWQEDMPQANTQLNREARNPNWYI